MSETTPTPSLELFISSDKAVEGANKFRVACEACATAVERLGGSVEKLDGQMSKLGERTVTVGTPMQRVGELVRATGGEMEDAGKASKKLGEALDEQQKVLGKGVSAHNAFNVAGRTTARTFALIEVATGTSFAQVKKFTDSFATLASVALRNPWVALATGAAAVVGAFTLFSSSSEETSKKVREQAQAAKDLEERYRAIADAVAAVARGPSIFDSKDDTLQKLGAVQEKIRETADGIEKMKGTRVDLDEVLRFRDVAGPDSQLAKIKALLDSIPQVQEAFRKANDRFSEFNVVKGFEDQMTALGVSAERVVKDLYIGYQGVGDLSRKRLLDDKKALDLLAEAMAGIVKKENEIKIDRLVDDRKKELDIALLSGAEREKALLLAKAEQLTGKAITDDERKKLELLGQQIADSQKLIDAKKREAQETERQAKQQADLPKNLEALERKYQDQLRIAQETGLQRELIRADIEAENDAKQIGLALDSDALAKLKDSARETARLRYEEQQAKKAAPVDKRQNEAITKLEQEEQLLQKTGRERENYRKQIEAENEAREAGLKIGSAEYQDYIRRKKAVLELAEAQRTLAQLGGQFGDSVSGALERIAIDGEHARDVLRDLGKEIERIVFRQLVSQPISNGFASFFASFAGKPGAPTGGAHSSIGAPSPGSLYPEQRGGIIPAMGGQVIDNYSFLFRGGRQYSAAEGGATTPEAIFPLQRDQHGRLGVVGAGGGGSDTIHMSFPSVRNAQDARAMRATLGQRVRQLRDADRRGRRGLRPRE